MQWRIFPLGKPCLLPLAHVEADFPTWGTLPPPPCLCGGGFTSMGNPASSFGLCSEGFPPLGNPPLLLPYAVKDSPLWGTLLFSLPMQWRISPLGNPPLLLAYAVANSPPPGEPSSSSCLCSEGFPPLGISPLLLAYAVANFPPWGTLPLPPC
jgi:hypothetical protein